MPPNTSGEQFLKKIYWSKENFRKAVEKSLPKQKIRQESIPQKPQEKINLYLKRIEKIIQKRGNLFKDISLYPEFIIKPENITDDYIRNIVLGNFAEIRGYDREQLKDPQIRKQIEQLFIKETGRDINTYQISEEEREQIIESIITDQKTSLDIWFRYLSSSEAQNYPVAFRYWAFAEILKLGSYNPERKSFNLRTETTVSPFPELNQQALAIVLDEIIKKQKGEKTNLVLTPEQQKQFEKILESENFGRLYGWALDYVKSLKTPKERLAITQGKWITFSDVSQTEQLVNSISGYNTGWCIAGHGTAENYLRHSKIHIYYSLDEQDNPKIPRLAIVENKKNNQITEVRGIIPGQHLDDYIIPVAEKKLNELTDGKKWLKKTGEMKKLAEIHIKHLRNEPLTKEDLIFIYEINSPISFMGYNKDSRIDEILKTRNIKKDLSYVFDIPEDKISIDQKEALKGDILYHYGNLDFSYITSLKGLKLPKKMKGNLYLQHLTSAEEVEFPEEIGGSLYLSSITSTKGLKLPQKIGEHLNLQSLTSAEGLEFPEEIGGIVDLSNIVSLKKVKLPQKIGRYLNLSNLTSAEEVEFPEEVGEKVDLSKVVSLKKVKLPKKIRYFIIPFLNSAEEVEFPEEVMLMLDLPNIISLKKVKLPKKIGGYLNLSNLTSAEEVEFPEEIGGDFYLSSITSIDELNFAKLKVSGTIYLDQIPMSKKDEIRSRFPNLKIK